MAFVKSVADCSALADMSGFMEYVQILRNVTGFNETLLGFCQNEICGALWGVGNADVSGIGVTVAYVISIVLGFILALCCHLLRLKAERQSWKRLVRYARRPMERAFESFFTSAIYFTISILVASTYALARKDYDISANGFGILESQITYAVTVIAVLPLLYPAALGIQDEKDTSQEDPHNKEKTDYNRRLSEKFRLLLCGFVVALFIYPFVTQCIHNWGPTDVGEGNGPDSTTIVNSTEWTALTNLCFGGFNPITDSENTAISVFELVGSLLSILVLLWIIVRTVSNDVSRRNSAKPPEISMTRRILASTNRAAERFRLLIASRPVFHIILLLCPLLLSIPLLWGIFRLREVQKALAKATTNTYLDDEWSFGQVVAILIFAPVVFDMIHCSFEIE